MWTRLIVAAAACLALPQLAHAQDAKATLDGVVKAMGDVKSVQYSGSGAYFAFGQAYTPGTAWPRFGVKSWTRTVDYETPAMRDEYVRLNNEKVALEAKLHDLKALKEQIVVVKQEAHQKKVEESKRLDRAEYAMGNHGYFVKDGSIVVERTPGSYPLNQELYRPQ